MPRSFSWVYFGKRTQIGGKNVKSQGKPHGTPTTPTTIHQGEKVDPKARAVKQIKVILSNIVILDPDILVMIFGQYKRSNFELQEPN